MATYDLYSTTPSTLAVGDIINLSNHKTYKSILLPIGKYKLEVWGAQGGYRTDAAQSGKGGYARGTLELKEKTTVYLYPGGAGGVNATATSGVVAGGYNGGGYRYGYPGGGGGSDIRIGSTSLYARVIVAGGGGSDGGTSKPGGYGGGTVGGSAGTGFSQHSSYCGVGGNQTYSGYSSSYTITSQATSSLTSDSTSKYCGGFGFGGGGVNLSSGYGGAGGGGWYGGAGNVPDGSGDDDKGGGGGSGYVYTPSTSSSYPAGCKLTGDHYLTDTVLYNGSQSFTGTSGSSETGHSGDGYCRITVLRIGTPPPDLVTLINSKSVHKYYNATLNSSSSLTQTISISGVTANDLPIIDLNCSSSDELNTMGAEFSKVYKAESVSGGIKFYMTSAITTPVKLFIVVLKTIDG